MFLHLEGSGYLDTDDVTGAIQSGDGKRLPDGVGAEQFGEFPGAYTSRYVLLSANHFEANRSGNVTSEYSFEKQKWTPLNPFGFFDEIVWVN